MDTAAQCYPEPKSDGPFSAAALELRAHGLAPIPLGGDNGKKPLISSFTKMKRPPSTDTLLKWSEKYPLANVGIVTDLSGVTIVDIDDPALLDGMIERFGDTPLKTTTPSGGFHLWYLANGEPSRTGLDGLKVDIKARGGMVVVPPSVRLSGPHAGQRYGFLSGDWNDLSRLPKIMPGGLLQSTVQHPSSVRIPVGQRNDTLWRYLLRQAPYCNDIDTLIDVAQSWNNDQAENPLPDAEVVRTARSALKFQTEGRNWVGSAGVCQIAAPLMEQVLAFSANHGPHAVALYLKLQKEHAPRDSRGEVFPVVPKAMARDKVLPWTEYQFSCGLKVLREFPLLELVKRGGTRKGDANLYRFCSPCNLRGRDSMCK